MLLVAALVVVLLGGGIIALGGTAVGLGSDLSIDSETPVESDGTITVSYSYFSGSTVNFGIEDSEGDRSGVIQTESFSETYTTEIDLVDDFRGGPPADGEATVFVTGGGNFIDYGSPDDTATFIINSEGPTIENPSPGDGSIVDDPEQSFTVDLADKGTTVDEDSIDVSVTDADGSVLTNAGLDDGAVTYSDETLTIDPPESYSDGPVTVTIDAADETGEDAEQFTSTFEVNRNPGLETVDVAADQTVEQGSPLEIDLENAVSIVGSPFTGEADVTFGVDALDGQDESVTLEGVSFDENGAATSLEVLADGATTALSAQTESVAVSTELTDDTDSIEVTVEAVPDRITGTVLEPDAIDPGESVAIEAQVLDTAGDGIDGVAVTLETDGGGTFDEETVTSSENGVITGAYTAAIQDADGEVTVTLDADGAIADDGSVAVNPVSVEFALDESALNADGTIDAVSGGEANTVELTATLTSENPINGVPVSFSLDGVDGQLLNTASETDEHGEATVSYEVGDGDWETDVEVGVEVDADSTLSASQLIEVSEPELSIEFTAETESINPTGENELTATVTFEAPFSADNPQEGVAVGFSTDNEATLSDVDGSTDEHGTASTTYSPAEDDFGEDVTVTANLPDSSGQPEDQAVFAVDNNVVIDTTVDLAVDAPGGVAITVELQDEAGNTVTTTEAETVNGDGEVSVIFGEDIVLDPGEYAIEVTDVDGGYESGVVEHLDDADGDETVVLALEADDVTIAVDGELELDAPEDGFALSVDVAVPGSSDGSAILELGRGVKQFEKTLTDIGAIDFGDQYTVTVDAVGYDAASTTVYVPPGETDSVDVGQLDAQDGAIEAEARLNIKAPTDAFEVTYELVGEDISETVPVDEGETAVDPVVFDDLDPSSEYEIDVSAAGYDGASLPAIAFDPGQTTSVESDLLELTAQDGTVLLDAELDTDAPSGGINVTYDVGGDSVTVEFAEGETTRSQPVLFEPVEPMNADEVFSVSVSADGYESTVVETYVAPGETVTLDGDDLLLEAESATLTAEADLNVTVPDAVLEFELRDSSETVLEMEQVSVHDGDSDVVIEFDPVDALGFDDEYTVAISADEYETDGVEATAEAVPGGVETVTFEDPLKPVNSTVTVDATLEAAPGEETDIEFVLRNAETDTELASTIESAGAATTDLETVAFDLDFTDDDVGVENDYEVVVSAVGGNENYEPTDVQFGELRPNEHELADDVVLTAAAATVDARATLNAEPGEETTVTFSLVDTVDGLVVDESETTVGGDEIETDEVTLTAAFSDTDVETGSYEVMAVATGGNQAYGADTIAVDQVLAPGAERTVETLSLVPEPATVEVDAGLVVPPGEETIVEFELLDATGEVVDQNNTVVDAEANGTALVMVAADFDAGAQTGTYTVNVDAVDGNTEFDAAEIDVGTLVVGAEVDATETVELDGVGSIVGSVSLADGTAAVFDDDDEALVEITATTDAHNESILTTVAVDQSDATYELEDVPFAHYNLSALVVETDTGETTDFDIDVLGGDEVTVAGEATDGLNFEAAGNGTVEGTITFDERTEGALDTLEQDDGITFTVALEGEHGVSETQSVTISGGTAAGDVEFEGVPFDEYAVAVDVTETDLGLADDFDLTFADGNTVTLDASTARFSDVEAGATGTVDVQAGITAGIGDVLADGERIELTFTFEDKLEERRTTTIDVGMDDLDSEPANDTIELPYGTVNTTAVVTATDVGTVDDFDVDTNEIEFVGDRTVLDRGTETTSALISGEGAFTGSVTVDTGTAAVLDDGELTLEIEAKSETEGERNATELTLNSTATDGVAYEFEELPFAPYTVSIDVLETAVGEPSDFDISSEVVSVISAEQTAAGFDIVGEGTVTGELFFDNETASQFEDDEELEVWISAENESEYITSHTIDGNVTEQDPSEYTLAAPFGSQNVSAAINGTDVGSSNDFVVVVDDGPTAITLNDSTVSGPVFVIEPRPAPSLSTGPTSSISGDVTGFVRTGDDLSATVTHSEHGDGSQSSIDIVASAGGSVDLEFVSADGVESGEVSLDRLEMRLASDVDDRFEVRQGPTLDSIGAESPSLEANTDAIGYFSVTHDAAGSFAETTLTVTVPEEILSDYNGTASDLTVYHHVENEWTPLETAVVDEINEAVTIEATTSGFSAFAVGLDSDETDAEDDSESDAADDADTDEDFADDAADDVETGDSPDDDTDSVPGFSVVVTLLAVIVVALLRLHRNGTAGSRSPPSFR